ncbi:hypothetical protein DNF23_28730 [Pseudomonas syringae pv. pisi]
MGLTVGRGRINKNELARKYLERFVAVVAGRFSFLTLQRGNAVQDALRQKRTRSVQNGVPTRSVGTIINIEPIVPHAPVGMQFTTLCVARGRGASRTAYRRGASAR